jgi:hypothetical protein
MRYNLSAIEICVLLAFLCLSIPKIRFLRFASIDEHTNEGKRLVAFLKTQHYIEILEEPNATTKKAIRDVDAGKVKKAKNPEDLFRQILGTNV